MFEKLFNDREFSSWLGSPALAEHVRSYAMALHRSGSKSTSLRQRVHAAAHLAHWLDAQGLELEMLDEEVLQRFREHFSSCSCDRSRPGVHEHTALGAGRFLRHLRDEGVVAPRLDACDDPCDELVGAFVDWLERQRGLAAATIGGYRSHVAAIVDTLGPDPARYDVASVRRFILAHLSNYSPCYAKAAGSAFRVFLRFLAVKGQCPPELVDAIPKVANWSLADVPRHLSEEDVEAVIDSAPAQTRGDIRNRAIILLLARLGLRARDILELRLDDLDWQRGLVRVTGKGRRQSWLPLPQDAGDAVLEYLENARPQAPHEHLFLRSRAPFRPIRSSGTVSLVVRNAIKRAAIAHPDRTSSHVFRHSLARRLLAQEVPLEAISVVLRHRNVQTSARYAKLDASTLETVVQPWPTEVKAC